MKSNLLALGGAVLGGVAGYFAFVLLLKQGFYGLAIPGGLLGLGAGVVKNKSIFVAILCGLMATALGLYCEWQFFPFPDDKSLAYFLTHFQKKETVTLIMIGLGGFIGFWVPFRSKSRTTPATHTPSAETK